MGTAIMRRKLHRALVAGMLLCGGVVLAGPSQGGGGAEAAFEAHYPHVASPAPTSSSRGPFAGVDLAALAVPGLVLAERVDETVDDGGVSLSFADAQGTVRAVVRVAVGRDENEARGFLRRSLHAVARILPEVQDPALGDVAYANDGVGRFYVAAAAGNVAYVVRTIARASDPEVAPDARTLAALVRARMVAGIPQRPVPTVALPPEVSLHDGAPIVVGGTPGQGVHLRAEGAYVAHGATGPVVRPSAAGPIAVIALVADELGRVGEARAESLAR
ncbi:MAG: hypothetical protein NVS3B10_17640 [Polyangiales bacterium]